MDHEKLRDLAIRELGLDPYQVLSYKQLIIRALERLPAGASASVGEIEHQLCLWGRRDINRRHLTKLLSSMRAAGILRGRGRAWAL